MTKNSNTNQANRIHTAFVNSAYRQLELVKNRLEKMMERLEKTCGDSGELSLNFEILQSDDQAAKLSKICKKLDRASKSIADAHEVVADMCEEMLEAIPLEEPEPMDDEIELEDHEDRVIESEEDEEEKKDEEIEVEDE